MFSHFTELSSFCVALPHKSSQIPTNTNNSPRDGREMNTAMRRQLNLPGSKTIQILVLGAVFISSTAIGNAQMAMNLMKPLSYQSLEPQSPQVTSQQSPNATPKTVQSHARRAEGSQREGASEENLLLKFKAQRSELDKISRELNVITDNIYLIRSNLLRALTNPPSLPVPPELRNDYGSIPISGMRYSEHHTSYPMAYGRTYSRKYQRSSSSYRPSRRR